jgi:hypothetical protein
MSKFEWEEIDDRGMIRRSIRVEEDGIYFDKEEIQDGDMPWLGGTFLSWKELWKAHEEEIED